MEFDAIEKDLVALRRDIHQNPELGYEEERTSQLVATRLQALGIEVERGLGGTGVVGTLKGSLGEGPTLGLRADMDALPMDERGERPHKSARPGVFHGCGHDGHTAMLLGAAELLSTDPSFRGTARFVFQPAEEGLAGARAMMDDGLFERFPVDEIYAMHNWPGEPVGTAAVRSGPVMAASDRVEIDLFGQGAHAAMPHKGVDPIVAAGHVITALQTIVSRGTDPQDSAVVSITRVDAGSTYNVIPESAHLFGTYRTFAAETRTRVEEEVERVTRGVAEALGARCEVRCMRGYPPTVNHANESDVLASAAERALGAGTVRRDAPPCMGGEDFAFMLEEVPGAYLWLGAGDGPNLHHPDYDFNDDVLRHGVETWVELVRGRS
ncbi:MAG: M20 aminoacylase family protein [Planctomycetota bacterium]